MMSNAAILSIKPVYANQILDGTKTLTSRPGASEWDSSSRDDHPLTLT
jgi:hypothetical protein